MIWNFQTTKNTHHFALSFVRSFARADLIAAIIGQPAGGCSRYLGGRAQTVNANSGCVQVRELVFVLAKQPVGYFGYTTTSGLSLEWPARTAAAAPTASGQTKILHAYLLAWIGIRRAENGNLFGNINMQSRSCLTK